MPSASLLVNRSSGSNARPEAGRHVDSLSMVDVVVVMSTSSFLSLPLVFSRFIVVAVGDDVVLVLILALVIVVDVGIAHVLVIVRHLVIVVVLAIVVAAALPWLLSLLRRSSTTSARCCFSF